MNHSLLRVSFACLFAIAAIFTGCQSDEQGDAVSDSNLAEENVVLKKKVNELDSMISRVGFGSKLLNANLDSIARLEARISQDLKNAEEDSILLDRVHDISNLVTVNRSIIEDLKSGMDDGDLSTKLLLDIILKLDDRIRVKEMEINKLNDNIDNLGAELKDLLGDYTSLEKEYARQRAGLTEYQSKIANLEKELTSKDVEIDSKEIQLNRAYYFFGEKKELMSMGIIKKSNLFTNEINEDFNLSNLNKVDIREFKELSVPGLKSKIISDHPQESYTLTPEGSKLKLTISNYKLFWSISKTLIIQTDS